MWGIEAIELERSSRQFCSAVSHGGFCLSVFVRSIWFQMVLYRGGCVAASSLRGGMLDVCRRNSTTKGERQKYTVQRDNNLFDPQHSQKRRQCKMQGDARVM